MKTLIIILSIPVIFFSTLLHANTEIPVPRIGVVENQYDHVEKLLTKMKIPYSQIKYRDLEKESLYSSYDVIFLPCGAEMPLTSSVNILSRGSHIEGVSLNDQYYKIDMKKAGSYIADFVKNGGSVYITDFSYRYINEELKSFEFYKGFPFLGLPGQIKTKVQGELSSYIFSPTILLTFRHNGWVVPAEINNAEKLLSADCETPLGIKNSPIMSLIREGNGQILFSSYHDETDTYGLMRYLIFKSVYKEEADLALKYAAKWEQKVLSNVVDRVVSGELSRVYSMKLNKGKNYIYFKSDDGEWLIDIFDQRGSLIFSSENREQYFKHLIEADTAGTVTVKIVLLGRFKPVPYTVTSVSGIRFIPYFIHIALGVIAFILMVFYLMFLRQNRSRGRIHLPGGG